MKSVEIYTTPFCGVLHGGQASSHAEGRQLFRDRRFARSDPAAGNDAARPGRAHGAADFVGEIHVGGCDELYMLDRAGKLDPLLAE